MALSLSDILGFEAITATGTSLSTTCTVPANCGAILALHARYTVSSIGQFTALTIGGNSHNDIITGQASDEVCTSARLFPGLSSGSQAVSGTMTTRTESAPLLLVYLSTAVDAAAFVAEDALPSGPVETSAKSFTLTGLVAGNLVLQFDTNAPPAADDPDLPSSWSNVTNAAGVPGSSTQGYRASAIVATGTTQACASQPGVQWSTLVGVGLQEAVGGGQATLSSPTASAVASTGANVGATTDQGSGTLYAVVTTSATSPSASQVKAGQDHTGAAAITAGSMGVASTGALSFRVQGLLQSTGYYAHLVQNNANGDSNVVSSSQFTTASHGFATGTGPRGVAVLAGGPTGAGPTGMFVRSTASGAGSNALDAILATSSSVTSNLLKLAALNATLASITTTTSNLLKQVPLTASLAAQSTTTVALLRGVNLAASMAMTAQVTSELLKVVQLSASPASLSTLTASIAIARNLSAALTSEATLTGSMHAGLTANLTAQSLLSGNLTGSTAFSALMAGVVTLTATPTVIKPLTASLTSEASVASNLLKQVALAASMQGQAAASADLLVGRALAALLASQVSLTGSQTVLRPLVSSLLANSSVTATLGKSVNLAASLAGQSTTTADLTIARLLSAILQGQSSVSASLNGDILLGALLASSSSILSPRLLAGLTSSMSVQATLTPTPAVLRPLQASVAAQATLTANSTLNIGLQAAIQSAATLTGNASLATALLASLQTSSTVTSSLRKQVDLDTAMQVSTSMSSTMAVIRNLMAILETQANLTGFLSGGQLVEVRKRVAMVAPARIRLATPSTRALLQTPPKRKRSN